MRVRVRDPSPFSCNSSDQRPYKEPMGGHAMRPESVNNDAKANESEALPLKAGRWDGAIGRVRRVNYVIA